MKADSWPWSAATTCERVSQVRSPISSRPVNQEPTPWLASSSHQHFLHTRLHSPIRVMSAIISYAVTGWLPITTGSE
jgi:hypothetical protein